MSNKLPSLNLDKIKPITKNQEDIFRNFDRGKNLFINGSAGTGKTFVSLYLALNEVFNKPVYETDVYNITIVRSAVPTRDVGFLPGDLNEKLAVYEQPYRDIVDSLMQQTGIYDKLKQNEYISFLSTSFIRGLTIDNSVIIVDEIQNMSEHELDSIITRVGEGSRIIFCGDFFQSDLTNRRERAGLASFMSILDTMECFAHVELKEDDIVRSGLVKEFLIQKNRMERHIEPRSFVGGLYPNPITA